jgi:hypothetical protein
MWALIASAAVAFAVLRWALWPWAQLEHRRHRSRAVQPAAGQLWRLDDGLLYVVEVNVSGIRLLYTAPGGRTLAWTEDHQQWQQRLANRVCWFSGQTRELTQ